MTNSPLPSRIGVSKQVYLEFCQMSFLERFPDEVKYNVDNLNKGAYVGVPGSPQLLLKGRGGLSSRLPTVGEVNLSHLLLI